MSAVFDVQKRLGLLRFCVCEFHFCNFSGWSCSFITQSIWGSFLCRVSQQTLMWTWRAKITMSLQFHYPELVHAFAGSAMGAFSPAPGIFTRQCMFSSKAGTFAPCVFPVCQWGMHHGTSSFPRILRQRVPILVIHYMQLRRGIVRSCSSNITLSYGPDPVTWKQNLKAWARMVWSHCPTQTPLLPLVF